MITKEKIKEIMKTLGADLCGIASIDRFVDAPEGYHPLDVFPLCKSVISFGCRFPVGTLLCESHTPYTHTRNTITPKMDMIALDFCIEMKNMALCVYLYRQIVASGTAKRTDIVLLFLKSMLPKLPV